MDRTLTILYFAWVRERLGRDAEQVLLNDGVDTIADVLAMLSARSTAYADVLADAAKLRFALDQEYGTLDSPVGSARELAIFPPVTGG